MKTISLTLLCAALLSVNAVAHEGHDHKDGDAKWTACKADAEKLCKDVEPGEGRIMKCLKEHESELSEGCKAKGGAMKQKKEEWKKEHPEGAAAMEACKADKEKLCKDVEPGEGRIVDCMKSHKADLSSACRDMMDKKGDFAEKKGKKKEKAEKPEGGRTE